MVVDVKNSQFFSETQFSLKYLKMLRHRHVKSGQPNVSVDDKESVAVKSVECHTTFELNSCTYWLTRILLLRYIAFIYCVAFLVAYNQNEALIGTNGLLPADKYLAGVRHHAGNSLWNQLQVCPSLLIVFSDYDVDTLLNVVALFGLALAVFVLISGAANVLIMLTLWLLYHSIVNVGQRWYSFGWESQLLETGFLAAFLCPLITVRRLPSDTPTSRIVLWGFRWLITRIMFGAGLIKIRGDQCWRDLTCMNYHYETQPVPNPASYYMHQEPVALHKFETAANHFVELVAPTLLMLPGLLGAVGGLVQVTFQLVLIISGNLSFLNWLTIAPCLACFNDRHLQRLFSGRITREVYDLQRESQGGSTSRSRGSFLRRLFNISLGVLLAYLSIPIVQNLLSTRQIMNTSFDPLRLVNTYGAFGSITKERTEVIFQGTYADNPHAPATEWLEYEFKCKPGRVDRRPCVISPYHYRLDWLMWFAAFQNYQHNPWLIHLGAKFLMNDKAVTSLIEFNPFNGRDPPKWVRAEHYRYKFTVLGSKAARNGTWWTRRRIGYYLPPISLDSIADIMKSQGWTIAHK